MVHRGGFRVAAAVAACALVGVLGGCGSDDEASAGSDPTTGDSQSTETDDPGESDDTDAPDDGECQWVSADAVTEAVGQPMTLDTAGEAGCIFKAEAEGGPAIWVMLTEIAIDQKEYADGSKETCDEPITDVDAGDIAFTCMQIDPQGTVFKDKLVATVDAKDFESDDAAFAALAKLLPEIDL
ncbi:hypothetical protein [Blastococcus sp. Marseille-P5729]|uniref:hypothetical protein n=1 Tax=Blastococcus sp. Marseille-P5729 TaxID=2086582 RepID=UPI00131D2307|nr:hypothetical protein [Blastococcus sp. Marseille-P5729]